MWGHAHDEYVSKRGDNNNNNNNTNNENALSPRRDRGSSRPKRPTRPRSHSPEDGQQQQQRPNYKYRGKGKGNNKENGKPNPWTHAHDEYAKPKSKKNSSSQQQEQTPPSSSPPKRTKTPKNGKRPVRIRFDTETTMNTALSYETDDEQLEEKSNRPLQSNRIRKRPKKKPTYINAANIHGEFRSAYRSKPLPPDPRNNRKTNAQRIENGKEQFNNMIKQAAQMEGLDKNDVRVQRMIQRLGDQMSDVTGFNRFLQTRDDELAKMVSKQEKRKKQMNKLNKKFNETDSNHNNNHRNSVGSDNNNRIGHARKGSVKDLTARFEKQSKSVTSNSTFTRRERHTKNKNRGRNALKLPNTKSHRRRVSSQFGTQQMQQITAVLLNNNGNDEDGDPPQRELSISTNNNNNNMNNNQLTKPSQQKQQQPHRQQHRLSISHSGASMGNRSIIISQGNNSTVILGDDVGRMDDLDVDNDADNDDMVDDDGATTPGGGDPLSVLLSILNREPVERTDEEIDILVQFFENYQIMTEDVDTWSGKATFRSFIQQTRFKYINQGKYIFREGDEGDEFYFVLRGNVSVLVDDASTVSTTKKSHNKSSKHEIHIVEENHVFGEIAMFNQGKRSATCVAKTDTYLAFWDRATYDEYIRPMKELKSKAQKILRDKQGNMLSEDQLIEKAAMFLDDAMHGRELKMHRNGPWPRRIHKLINHKYFNYCLIMVSMLYLSLIFIEPPSYWDSIIIDGDGEENNKYYYRIMPLIAFEWFVFFIFLIECLLRFYSFGASWFFTIDLHIMRVILLIIFGIDLIITCIYNGTSFRFSRVFRPIFPILFIRDLRRQYYIVLACVPYIIELIILWLIIAAIFARVAYHIFYHSQGYLQDGVSRPSVYMQHAFENGLYPYDEQMAEYCQDALIDDSLTRCDQFFDFYVWNSFSTFFKSLIALFVLLTTENFPEVWWPTWLANDGKTYWSFFIIYALIAVFFLLNLFSAAVYDAYQHIISKLDVIDEKRETQALKVAWICLDTGDSGAIGYQKFENLMYRLKPEYSEFEIEVIFKLLDPDNNRLIDAEEFSVMMINVLYLSISRKTRSKDDELKLYLQKLGGSCPFGYEIILLLTSQTWRYIMLTVQAIDICALLSYHQYPPEMNIVDFVCIIIIIFALILDVIFKHMSQLKTYFKSSRNRLYFGLTLIQTIGSIIGIANDRMWVSSLRFFGILRILIVAVFALEKIKFLRTSLTRTLTQTVIFMIPVFGRIVLHVCVVLVYCYTVIGLEIFVPPDESQWGKDRCYAPDQIQGNPYALFCDANMAIITLAQILTTNDWHRIMYTAIEVTDNWFNALYFITFFFLGPILVLSLLLAMFFNMFFGVSMQSEHELSAFFHETDQEAKNLQQHMEYQDLREQIDRDMELRDIPLPTECGISTLPNGSKILTIRRPKVRPSKVVMSDSIQPLQEGEENDDENEDSNYENETKAQEMELVHIPLDTITRQIWENVPGQDWIDPVTNSQYKQTFNGKDASQYLLDAGFAPDGAEAVDYLSLIMEDIGAFMRVDSGQPQEFENDINAHYQWIHIPQQQEQQVMEEKDIEDHVALDDIMIGFRHSYGGYHRLLKQYRQAGLDPTQEAARQAVRNDDGNNNGGGNNKQDGDADVDNPDHNVDDNDNDKVNIADLPNHIRQKSEKLLKEGIMKLRKQDSDKPNPNDSPSPTSLNQQQHQQQQSNDAMMNDNDYKNQMDTSDDENIPDDGGTVIVLGTKSQDNVGKNTQMVSTNSTHVIALNKVPPNLNKIDSHSSDTNNQTVIKKRGSTKLKKGNVGSMELVSLNKGQKGPTTMMRKTQSNEQSLPDLYRRTTLTKQNEETTVAPLKTGNNNAAANKSKSMHQRVIKAGGLKRSASSKNILLAHLDKRGKK